MLLKSIARPFVVTPCLFIVARLQGFLLLESVVSEIFPSRNFFIDLHSVNELPVAGALPSVSPARTEDPITFFCLFND